MKLSLEIENFRSIRKSSLPLRRGLNVLVGPNGSGKTNILCALEFLRDVIVHGAALAMGRAGGARRNFYRGKKEIIFKVRADYGICLYLNRKTPFDFYWEIRISLRGNDQIPAISYEEFSVYPTIGTESKPRQVALAAKIVRPNSGSARASSSLIEGSLLGKDFFLQPNGDPRRAKKQLLFDNVRKEISEVTRKLKQDQDKSLILSFQYIRPSIRKFIATIRSLEEYNIQPALARKATDPVPEPSMDNYGEGVGEVIHAMKTGQPRRRIYGFPHIYAQRIPMVMFRSDHFFFRDDFSNKRNKRQSETTLDKIISNLSAAVNSIDNLDTEIDPSTGRRYVIFISGNERFLPEEVSDGTIKWLCLLVAMFVPVTNTFLLEEPENFMHPWMQQRLIEIMREQAQESDLIFLITTHSATILNSLHPEEVLLVQRAKGGTETKILEDTEGIQQFLIKSDFGLGDYWVSGGIGGVPSGEDL